VTQDHPTLIRSALIQGVSFAFMVAILLLPVVAFYHYKLTAFVYFNLMGVTFILMMAIFKLEAHLLGSNPFEARAIPLSPEVRAIILRIISWFNRHRNVVPAVVFGLFLLFVGAAEALAPLFDLITNPLIGFSIVVGAAALFVTLASVLQIVYWNALHPSGSSVSDLITFLERVGPQTELTPEVLEEASKTRVEVPAKTNKVISASIGFGCIGILELMGSGILSQAQTIEVVFPVSLMMMAWMIYEALKSVFSKKETLLEKLVDSS
jgi:hypothetical protein